MNSETVPKSSRDALADICYNQSFLKFAILRVDFAAPIESVSKALGSNVAKMAIKHFPIPEPQRQVAQELQITGTEITRKSTEQTIWNYHGKDREKRLSIGPEFLFVQRTKYSTYEDLKKEFFEVLSTFLQEYPQTAISRFGIRYVNDVRLSESNVTAWDKYLNPKLLGLYTFLNDCSAVSRVFEVIELNFGDIMLKFQFGMHNPDYPSPIRQKAFVLDLDAYYVGLQDTNELSDRIDHAHHEIQKLFELSIRDELRQLMRAVR